MAVNKFHINSQGVAKPCSANVRACRFGGDSTHFDTIEEAQKVAEKQLNEEFSHTPQSLTKKNKDNDNKYNAISNSIKKAITDTPNFSPESLMNVGKIFDNELANRIPFDINNKNLTYDDYEVIEKETHKLVREVMEVDEDLSTEVYGSLAKDLNKATKILPNSIKNGFNLKDIPILAKSNRIDNNSFSGQHQGNVSFKVNAVSQGVEVSEYEQEKYKDLPDQSMYVDGFSLASDFEGNNWGKRVKVKSTGSYFYKEKWIGKKSSQCGKKISDTAELYVNGRLMKLDQPVYEIKDTQFLTGSVIQAQKTDGKNGDESVLLHEYTHMVQMTDSTKAEEKMFEKLAYDQHYDKNLDESVFKGFPDEYMGLSNSREVLTRATEGFYKPTNNGYLYGENKGENADEVRQWVIGYWLSKDVSSQKNNKKVEEAIKKYKNGQL